MAKYFGSRWHYYIGDIIAEIPALFKFEKGQFESGLTTKVLTDFAADPFPYLDEAAKKKMMAVQSGLLRKFTDLALDQSAAMRWIEQEAEADNIDVGPPTDWQNDLFKTLADPF